MIRFSLTCEQEHGFEGWFRSNDDFDAQLRRRLVECPHCGSHKVEKALMAPAIATSRKKQTMALAMGDEQRRVMAEMKALAARVKAGADDVGDKFAEEARKIHFGETEARGIYGQASMDEAKALAEDGVPFLPMPVFPDDAN